MCFRYGVIYVRKWIDRLYSVTLVTPDFNNCSSRILRGMARVVISGRAFSRGDSISLSPPLSILSSIVNDGGCGSSLVASGAVLFPEGVAGRLVRPAAHTPAGVASPFSITT